MSPQSEQHLSAGQKVRHRKRPEWGTGTIVRAERVMQRQVSTQRLTVRFANAGVKTLTGVQDALEILDQSSTSVAGSSTGASDPFDPTEEGFDIWSSLDSDDWLGPIARQKLDELMTSLPMEARDPFASLEQRLSFTLDLYRFERHGRGLMDWAVAQTGLDDPLERFSRQELEAFFDRWAAARDAHLAGLLRDLRWDATVIERVSANAPASGVAMVHRLIARR